MLRLIKILISQCRNRSFLEFISVLLKSLFKVEKVLIYAKELDTNYNSTVYSDLDKYIIKGDLNELESIRKNMVSPPWEFNCHLYDCVTDFFIYKNNEGVITHISWIYYMNNPNRIINLGKKECEIKYSLTLPHYRGKGMYPATLVKIQGYLKENGYRRVFICVNKDNISSIKGIEKTGFKFITNIILIKVIGFQYNKNFSFSGKTKNI